LPRGVVALYIVHAQRRASIGFDGVDFGFDFDGE
jgi:hypothetical protein